MSAAWSRLREPAVPLLLLTLLQSWIAFGVRTVGGFGVETDFYATFAPRAAALRDGVFHPEAYGVVGPLYEALLALGLLLNVDAYVFAKALSVLSCLAAAALWTWIAARVHGADVARWVPWLFLLSPAFLRYGSMASTDALYLAVSGLAVAGVVRATGAASTVAAALAGWVAVLVRYQALILPWFALLWNVGRAPRRVLVYWSVFPVALAVVLGLAGAAGMALPEPSFLHNIHYATIADDHPDWDAYGETATERGAPGAILISEPDRVATAMIRSVPSHLFANAAGAAGWPLTLLSLMGVGFLFRAGAGRGDALRWALFWLIQFLGLLTVQASDRYALVQVPLQVVLAAWGVSRPLTWRAARSRMLAVAAVLGVLAIGLATNGQALRVHLSNQPAWILDVARDARTIVPPGSHIMARKPHLAYLLDSQWVYFPDTQGVAALRARMTEQPAGFVFFGGNEFALRPQYRFLAFPEYVPLGWIPALQDPGRYVLYAIHPLFLDAADPPDDDQLRLLQNAMLSAPGAPVEEARRLASYYAATGRCGQAELEFDRLSRITTLTEADRSALEKCRAPQPR